jgi:hypothetical protein
LDEAAHPCTTRDLGREFQLVYGRRAALNRLSDYPLKPWDPHVRTSRLQHRHCYARFTIGVTIGVVRGPDETKTSTNSLVSTGAIPGLVPVAASSQVRRHPAL